MSLSTVLERSELDAPTREAALAWAAPLASDVRRAVASCPDVAWLEALARGLDQRVVWHGFRYDVDEALPERVWAREETARRAAAGEPSVLPPRPEAGTDPALRAAAWKAYAASPIGRAAGARASRDVRQENIEGLRRSLDADRMIAALAALAGDETPEERRERQLAEVVADIRENASAGSSPRTAAIHGSIAGLAFGTFARDPAMSQRIIAASKAAWSNGQS